MKKIKYLVAIVLTNMAVTGAFAADATNMTNTAPTNTSAQPTATNTAAQPTSTNPQKPKHHLRVPRFLSRFSFHPSGVKEHAQHLFHEAWMKASAEYRKIMMKSTMDLAKITTFKHLKKPKKQPDNITKITATPITPSATAPVTTPEQTSSQ